MTLLYALLTLAAYLAVQAAIGRLAPWALRWVDLMLVPVAWYGIRGAQRRAMVVGCVAGLLQDVWFETGILGFNATKKTILGWSVGAVGSRFDLNRRVWQVLSGGLLSVADHYLGVALLRLFGQRAPLPDALTVGGRAGATALIVCTVFVMFDRAKAKAGEPKPRPRQVGRAF